MVIITSTIIGLGIALSNTDLIQALIYAAVINGIVAVPILFIILKISNDKTILANRTNSLFSRIVGWITFTIMAVSVIAFLILTWNQYQFNRFKQSVTEKYGQECFKFCLQYLLLINNVFDSLQLRLMYYILSMNSLFTNLIVIFQKNKWVLCIALNSQPRNST